MDLQDLRSFQVLAEELSFPAAAGRLRVSASSLAKRVQRLEQRLGVRLVEPATSSQPSAASPAGRPPGPFAPGSFAVVSVVSLTREGAWLVSRATALLDQWQGMADQIHLLDAARPVSCRPAAAAPVRLAIPIMGSGTLQAYLAAALPAPDVTVVLMPAAEAMERLGDGDGAGVDAVLVYDPDWAAPGPVAPGAHVATVLVDPVWVLLGARHRLAERDEVTVQEVVDHGLPWILSPPNDLVRQWEEIFLRGRAPQAQLREASDMSKVDIARGRAVELASPLLPPNELLAMRPLAPTVTVRVSLSWLPHRLPGAAAADLLTAIRGFCRHQAQQHPRYWRWILDHPDHFPGIAPDPQPGPSTAAAPATGPTSDTGSGNVGGGGGGGAQGLSVREREVLTLVAAGLNDAEIAHELQLSPTTAKTHVKNIRAKLGARDRVHLVVIAYRHGLTR